MTDSAHVALERQFAGYTTRDLLYDVLVATGVIECEERDDVFQFFQPYISPPIATTLG